MPPRSKIKQLPASVRDWLDRSLIEGNFSGYELLEAELKARGFDIGKSAIHRYGQEFEDKLAAIRIATEQARAITDAIPDDAGAMNDALIRLVQQKAFDTLVKMEEGASIKDIGLMVARLSNATVKQKQWQVEIAATIRAEERAKAAEEATSAAKAAGASPETIAVIRRALGITA